MRFPSNLTKLRPLLVNKKTGEPYLQLPSPHDNIRITPPRPDDIDITVSYLNDPRIYTHLAGPPFPYTTENGIQWNKMIIDKAQELFQEIDAGNQYINGPPIRSIREVQEDGTDVLIGDIDLKRELPDVAWAEKEDADNLLKPAGDPTIVWTIGDYLAPSHRRRGIMSAALRTLIEGWAIPRMNCRTMMVTAFVGNVASVGVFKKVGFEYVKDIEDAIALPEGRGGHLKSLHILKWEYAESRD